ncbi:MAG: hypothetical protein HOO06_08050 [Bdellovibrionaceae bacterium]|jgi:hypothetical protein|nr:hypothetical protein [Pseudobdellovibrionaceae bacterium]
MSKTSTTVKTILSLSVILISLNSQAFFIESNILYYDNTLKSSSTTQATDIAVDLTLGLSLTKGGRSTIGWSYLSLAPTSVSGSTTITTTATGMGPKFKYYMNKGKNWSIALTYILNATVNYAVTSATAQEWRGTIMKLETGYTQEVSETVTAGVNLNYYSSSLSESIVSTAYSTIAYSQTWIYPSFFISYRL